MDAKKILCALALIMGGTAYAVRQGKWESRLDTETKVGCYTNLDAEAVIRINTQFIHDSFKQEKLVVGKTIKLQFSKSIYRVKSIEKSVSYATLQVRELRVVITLERVEPRMVVLDVPLAEEKKTLIFEFTLLGNNYLLKDFISGGSRVVENNDADINVSSPVAFREKTSTRPTHAGWLALSACVGAAAKIGSWVYESNSKQ